MFFMFLQTCEGLYFTLADICMPHCPYLTVSSYHVQEKLWICITLKQTILWSIPIQPKITENHWILLSIIMSAILLSPESGSNPHHL